MENLLKQLNELNIIQKSYELKEDLPQVIYKKHFKNLLASGLEVDKHRWYETSIYVFKTELGIIGVRAVTDLFSEMGEIEDVYHKLEFFEMQEITTVTYIKK